MGIAVAGAPCAGGPAAALGRVAAAAWAGLGAAGLARPAKGHALGDIGAVTVELREPSSGWKGASTRG